MLQFITSRKRYLTNLQSVARVHCFVRLSHLLFKFRNNEVIVLYLKLTNKDINSKSKLEPMRHM